MNAEAYLQSRHRDYFSLSREIAEARKGNIVDLGYCQIVDNREVIQGQTRTVCGSLAEAVAFVLRRFW